MKSSLSVVLVVDVSEMSETESTVTAASNTPILVGYLTTSTVATLYMVE